MAAYPGKQCNVLFLTKTPGMKSFNLSIAILSFVTVLLGLFYKRLKKSPFNETFLSTLIGVALGPFVFNVLDITDWGRKEDIMDKACRLTLAMALMATAFRIPQKYLFHNKSTQAVLLFMIMPAMFLTAATIIHFITGTEWPLSLLIGAIVTPTDPVLASTIITGEKAEEILSQRMRSTISFEAGANDGLAFPFVMLCLYLIENKNAIWQHWTVDVLLRETLGAVGVGLLLGYILGKALDFCIRKNYTSKPAILAFALSVAFFVLTALEFIHVNSILAIFIVGLMLKNTLSNQKDIEEEGIQEMMSRLFTIPIFVFFGIIIPWQQWIALGWIAVALPILILVFRRLPFLFLCKPFLKDFKAKDLAFIGWFGPMGIAALFYCFFSYDRLHIEKIWTFTSLIVFSSVVVHGMSAYPFLKLYSKSE